jgi:hypothetical protein
MINEVVHTVATAIKIKAVSSYSIKLVLFD